MLYSFLMIKSKGTILKKYNNFLLIYLEYTLFDYYLLNFFCINFISILNNLIYYFKKFYFIESILLYGCLHCKE